MNVGYKQLGAEYKNVSRPTTPTTTQPPPPPKWSFSVWQGPNVNQPKQMVWSERSGWPWLLVTRGGRQHEALLLLCAPQLTPRTSRPLRRYPARKVKSWQVWRLCGYLSTCHGDRKCQTWMRKWYSKGFSSWSSSFHGKHLDFTAVCQQDYTKTTDIFIHFPHN